MCIRMHAHRTYVHIHRHVYRVHNKKNIYIYLRAYMAQRFMYICTILSCRDAALPDYRNEYVTKLLINFLPDALTSYTRSKREKNEREEKVSHFLYKKS